MSRQQTPKYIEIANELRQKIRNGVSAGEKLPTETMLMQQYRVSRHTVRQALEQLVHERMLVRIPGRGTFVADGSVLEHAHSNNLIAVIMTYISDYIFPSIIRGIEQSLREHSYNLLLLSTQNQFELERRALETAIAQDCCGIILEPVKSTIPNPNLHLFQQIYQRRLPLILLHAEPPGFPPFHKILFDDLRGAEMLTTHLLDQGHRNIGGIFKVDDKQGLQRFKGYVRALAEYHVDFNSDALFLYHTESKDIVTDDYVRSVFEKQSNRPTAVVCYNDEIAVRLIKDLNAAGLSVPADVSVVGFDDSHLALVSHPELTTIRHPKEKMGRLAADQLLSIIQEPDSIVPGKVVLPAEIVIRSSSKQLTTPVTIHEITHN